ncbi:hypothetical protein A1O1_00005 [Capronia coronata CBS 617.96]|uniref:Topoisomerase 6 subunit A/Spo11 TOPRIM domain-containing protein n=1 Tax=Capronia coronata CBS 617.96 TaxID=1182541 RepID=W9YPR3_9EURO|nr:uncharacterized protein A1O1_00005 [Capronia coronata CBS 617.96]EXJ94887.1 hypothetical protein A1O1_00005 [Capronia coronata CBS 617.96]
MASERPQLINLDWRTPLKCEDIIIKLQCFVNQIDAKEQVSIISSQSKFRKLEAVNNGSRILRQTKHSQVKSIKPADDHYDTQYLGRLSHIAQICAENACLKRVDKSRAFSSQIKSDEMSPEQAAKVLNDLALTLEVHPFLLGVEPEPSGLVFVPDGVKISAQQAFSARSFAETKTTFRKALHGGTCHNIPRLTTKLSIFQVSTNVRAVIVSEHQSIIDELATLSGDARLRGVIFVATNGYPDIATREFLNQLSHNPACRKIPFLYASDGDPQGIEIYAVLKYGSKQWAFAAPQMTCTPLKWAGLSLGQWKTFVDGYRERYVNSLGPMEPASRQEEANRAKRQAKDAKQWLKYLKSRKPTLCDKSKLKTLLKVYFDGIDRSEDDVRLKLERFMDDGQVNSQYCHKLGQHTNVFNRSLISTT